MLYYIIYFVINFLITNRLCKFVNLYKYKMKHCTTDKCPQILDSSCVFYEGPTLLFSGINTNDSVEIVIQKLNLKLESIPGINLDNYYTKTEVDTALSSKQDVLNYTPENIANKSDSYTASSSTTYASSKALVEGLATKLNKGTYTGTASDLVPYDNANKDVNIGANYFKTSKGFDYTFDENNYFRTFNDGNYNQLLFESNDDIQGNLKILCNSDEGFQLQRYRQGNENFFTFSENATFSEKYFLTNSGFKITNGTPNLSLTADGGTFDLDTKADLVGGKVPSSQLPSYVDDVLEFANLDSFPATGESGKIYIALDTNITYRWSGTGYAEISASLALGETSSTAYRGDRGKIAYDHSQVTHDKTLVGLGNVDNTSDLNKPISTATQNALNTKADLADVNNLQIGGRNLALNSKGFLDQNSDWVRNFNLSENLIVGQQYTVTVWVRAIQGINDYFGINDVNGNNSFPIVKKSDNVFSFTFVATHASNELVLTRLPYATSSWYQFESFKLEKGNKATDWTPAPEDKQDRLQDVTGNIGVGKTDASATEKLDVNGNVKASGFKKDGGTANQALTADGGTFDLNEKADLVGGKVPKAQSQSSTMVMDNSTYIITFTDATGAIQTIDLPLESLFQDANYDETTKSLIVTLQDGTTRTIPLSDLVDLPEIVLATSNPAVTPTSGQKVYFNTSLGKVWFNVSGAWVFGGNLISDTEKTNLSTAYNHSQTTGNPHNTTKSDIGLGNVPNVDATNPVNITQSSSYRFVTDTEKATWNAKQNALTDPITGTGTSGFHARFNGTSTLTNSIIYDNGTSVGIGTTSPQSKLEIRGSNVYDSVKSITLTHAEPTSYSGFIGLRQEGLPYNHLTFGTRSGGVDYLETLNIGNGKVGIGITVPSTLLDVNHYATFLANTGNRLKIWDGTDNIPTITADNLLEIDSPSIRFDATDVIDSHYTSIYLKLKTVNGNVTIDDSYHNKIVRITASCTITIPAGLRIDFNCTFEVIGAYTAQFVDGSGATTSAPFGRYLKTDLTAMFYCTGTASNYRLNGSLTTS